MDAFEPLVVSPIEDRLETLGIDAPFADDARREFLEHLDEQIQIALFGPPVERGV